MKISRKLPIAAAGLTVLTITVGAIISLTVSSQFLKEGAAERLQAVVDGRRNQTETYLHSIVDDLRSMSGIELTVRAADKFGHYYDYAGEDPQTELQRRYIDDNPSPIGQKHLLDKAGTDGYDYQHEEVHPFYRDFVEKRGYYDLFIVDLKGSVAYSVFKERDFATNLETGEWKDTGLARVWKRAIEAADPDKVFFEDYEAYGPSMGAPASFIGKAVFKRDRLKGVLIFQMPNDGISKIMDNTMGLGMTGESLLMKKDGLLISDSKKTTDINEALNARLNLDQNLMNAADGEQPVGTLEGYRDLTMTIATSRIRNFEGADWIVGALISDDEILKGVAKLRNITIASSLVLVIISLAIAVVFSRTITQPINDVVAKMKKLIGGDTSIELTHMDRKDEVGEMFQAVDVFRQAAIDKSRLEEEGEAARKETEEERRQNEKAKAKDEAKISNVIKILAHALGDLSAGNLNSEIITPFEGELDQIRVDFNNSVKKLNNTLTKINSVSIELRNNSNEIANTTVELSQRTEKQAASLEETSAALDEITATVRQTSDRAVEAALKAKEAHKDTEDSGKIVADAVSAMEGIEKASGDINSIINVIDEIAFQTNLLALNAGVEAARAGEAGKGFAVVAQEVRELAQRSANAAKEIKDLINNTSSEIGNGVSLVQRTGEALAKISKHVSEINVRIETISTGAQEQLAGIQEVNSAVNSMDQVTQQNAAMVEENTAVTHEISNEVAELTELISIFQVSEKEVEDNSMYQEKPLLNVI